MADLKASIVHGVAQAFRNLDSLKKEVTLVYGQGAYDPLTDTTGVGQQTAIIRGFIYSSEEQQRTASSGYAATILLQASDVVAAGLTGIVDEAYKAIAGGHTWEITAVIYDPADATVKLLVRHG